MTTPTTIKPGQWIAAAGRQSSAPTGATTNRGDYLAHGDDPDAVHAEAREYAHPGVISVWQVQAGETLPRGAVFAAEIMDWSIESGDGTGIAAGMDEATARRAAQETADRTGQAVYLREHGSTDAEEYQPLSKI
jgi:hypothetical protein